MTTLTAALLDPINGTEERYFKPPRPISKAFHDDGTTELWYRNSAIPSFHRVVAVRA